MSIDSQMAEVARIEMLLAEEENKRAKWKQENVRRRHNYLPLIMEMLRCLAERDELLPIYNKAKEKTIELEKKKEGEKSCCQSIMCIMIITLTQDSFLLINRFTLPVCKKNNVLSAQHML